MTTSKKKSKKAARDVVSPFRDKLWDLFKSLAEGMNGADVVVALKQAGEEIWAAGIDGTYIDMPEHEANTQLEVNLVLTYLGKLRPEMSTCRVVTRLRPVPE